MRIKRFNESFENLHTLETEYIEDFAQELVDDGFELEISKKFWSGGKRVNEPINKTTRPFYEIVFTRKGQSLEESPLRWDGSVYSEETQALSKFLQFLHRMERLGEVYWNIVGRRWTCQLLLPTVQTKTGFDWNDFKDKIDGFIDGIDFKIDDFWISGDKSMGLTFNKMISEDEAKAVLNGKLNLEDNKYLYDGLKEKIDEFLKPYSKWITWKTDFENKRTQQYEVKKGFLKKEKRSFTVYNLYLNIKVK